MQFPLNFVGLLSVPVFGPAYDNQMVASADCRTSNSALRKETKRVAFQTEAEIVKYYKPQLLLSYFLDTWQHPPFPGPLFSLHAGKEGNIYIIR